MQSDQVVDSSPAPPEPAVVVGPDFEMISDDVPLLPPANGSERRRRQKRRTILWGFIFLFGWIAGNVSAIVWTVYMVKPTIFPLSSESIAIHENGASWFFFYWLGWQWVGLWTIWNLVIIWAAAGPIVSRAPGNPRPEHELPRSAIGGPSRRTTSSRIFGFLKHIVFNILTLLIGTIICGAAGYLGWFGFPLQVDWQRHAWKNEICTGWDYTITFDGVKFDQLGTSNDTQYLQSNATIAPTFGSAINMTLQHPAPNISVIVIAENNTVNEVTFNFTSQNYSSTIDSSVGWYIRGDTLEFPTLSLGDQYSGINWNPSCSAPQVSLIDANDKEVFRTVLSNYDDCTLLKACGNGPLDRLVVPVSFILTESEKSGLCCTNPLGFVSQRIELMILVSDCQTRTRLFLRTTFFAFRSVHIFTLQTKQ
jgi:hypothetical protein